MRLNRSKQIDMPDKWLVNESRHLIFYRTPTIANMYHMPLPPTHDHIWKRIIATALKEKPEIMMASLDSERESLCLGGFHNWQSRSSREVNCIRNAMNTITFINYLKSLSLSFSLFDSLSLCSSQWQLSPIWQGTLVSLQISTTSWIAESSMAGGLELRNVLYSPGSPTWGTRCWPPAAWQT